MSRRITLGLPYYLNAGMLTEQLDRIRALPAEIQAALAVIVVDDGSPHSPARGTPCGVPLSIYRIDVDIRWNQDAARNIAAHEADTQWLLLTDMDHIVSLKAWRRVIQKKLSKEHVYRFSRQTLNPDATLTPYKPHPNSWLLTRAMYEKIGGYDERFAGFYGTDADFRDRVAFTAPIIMLDECLIRVPRETIPDASTTTYQRKAPEDHVGMRSVKELRAQEVDWKPIRFRQPYRLVYRDNA